MSTSEQHQPSPTVRYEVRDGVAVIHLANPPVNGLGDNVRVGLATAVTRAAHDDHVGAVVIVGEGRGFCGGADLRQFGTPAAAAEPTVPDVLADIRSLSKPVIAAIHGFALGGGLELALACHYRIARPDARLGLPEVNVGLIPGAGGTQRLPRLIGAAAALRMIQQGTTITGTEGTDLGLLDACFDGDPLTAAVKFLDNTVTEGAPGPIVDTLPPADATGMDFDAARRSVRPSTRNGRAQLTAIDAVETATRLPTAAGLAFKRAAFLGLLRAPESAALRHVFFAEKTAPKLSDGAAVSTRPISRVAVLGAGTMGSGIAMAFANGGLPVTLIEQNQDALDRGLARIRSTYESFLAKGKLDERQARDRIASIEPNLALDAAAGADLVVEAVFEDMAVKKEVFGKLDALCLPGTILASNTSRLDLDEIAAATTRPCDVIGLHFFSPANIMKLVEVVRGEATADDVVATGLALALQIGKVPVLSKVCEGFIGNRMLTPYRREAEFLLEEGATPQQIDAALQNFGMAMVRARCRIWRAWTSRGLRANGWPRPARRMSDTRGSPTPCARTDGSGRKAVPATTGTRRAVAHRFRTPPSTRSSAPAPPRKVSNAAPSPTTRSSTAASWRWSTKAPHCSVRVSPNAPPTSTSCTSTATDSQPFAAGRCTTPRRSAWTSPCRRSATSRTCTVARGHRHRCSHTSSKRGAPASNHARNGFHSSGGGVEPVAGVPAAQLP